MHYFEAEITDSKHAQETTAIILAAGLGRRMQPLSCHQHKALLSVGEKQVLQRILDALLVHPLNKIVIVTGYQSQAIENYIHSHFPDKDILFVHNKDYATSNNIVSLSLALRAIPSNQNVLLIECDLIFDDYLINILLSQPDKNIALVDHYSLGMDGTVVSLKDGIVNQIYPPKTQDQNFDFSDKYKTLNLYYFTADFCHGIFAKMVHFYSASIDNNCFYELVLSLIVYLREETVHALVVDTNSWAEIDDPNDLNAAEFKFQAENRKLLLDQGYGGYWNFPVKDFAFMHNPYFPSTSMSATLKTHCLQIITSYGSSQKNLNRKLAYFEQCDSEGLVALNGLSQIYPILKNLFQDKQIFIPEPSFGEYQRCFPHAMPYFDRPTRPETILEQLEKMGTQADVVVLVNPNNPTGTLIKTSQLQDLIQRNPNVLYVVDESFIDFTNEPSLLTEIERLGLGNVLLLKSMSKVWGVPGLRIGYAYTLNHTLREQILAELPIWNMNSLSEYFIELVLKYRNDLNVSLKQVASTRHDFQAKLLEFNFIKNIQSECDNFLLVTLNLTLEQTAQMERRLLEEHFIYLKNVTDKFRSMDGEINSPKWRLAVKSHALNESLLQALRAVS